MCYYSATENQWDFYHISRSVDGAIVVGPVVMFRVIKRMEADETNSTEKKLKLHTYITKSCQAINV